MGCDGVALELGQDIDYSIREIKYPHRNLPVIIFIAIPNLRREVIEAINRGELPLGFLVELLFASSKVPQKEISTYQSTDVYLDPQFTEGYFDRTNNQWVDNPNYWENQLREQQKKRRLE